MARKKNQQSPPVGLLVFGAFLAGVAITYAAMTVWHEQSGSMATSPPPQSMSQPTAPLNAPVETAVPGASYVQLVQSGHTFMDAQRYQSAINFYTAALAIDSSDANVWVDRGACKHAVGDGTGARADFRRGLELNSTHTIAHFNMGITYFTEQRLDSAKSWLSKVLILAPGSGHAKKAQELIGEIDAAK